jgi:single-stranded DNA-binding protein
VSDFNQVTLEGRLGTEPEVKTFGESRLVTCRFAVRRYNPKDKDEPFTDWYTLNAWSYQSDQLERMTKGDMIIVRGKLELKEYTAKSGETKLDVSVFVQGVFGPKKWIEDKPSESPKTGGSSGPAKEDDLPF